MFRRRKKDDLESTFECIDRGPVSSWSKGQGSWIECCRRCSATVHIVIMPNGKREKACPVCLTICAPRDDSDGGGGGDKPKAPRPNMPNRITRYLK